MVSRTNARVAVVLGLSLLIQFISAQTWTVQNRQIKKDGETFLVKGVNYAPLPPGSGVSEETQWGDLFHADWAHLHDRDLPLMRAAGVNSIRIYQLQLNYPNTNTELDHGSFFDKLYNNGDHSIYVMITYALSADWTYLGPFDAQPATGGYSFQVDGGKWYQIDDSTEEANALKREIQRNIVVEIATRYGTHPAVMGFVIGNEQNNAVTRANCKYWEWLDEIATAVKGAAPNKLTATTIVDDNFLTVAAAMQCSSLPHLDVWGINSYRGTELIGFDHLFDQFEALSNQALLITEFGCPSSTRDGDKFVMMPENSKLQGDYLQAHWDDIVAHSSVCSGGYAFSWIDEWWKIGNHGVQDPDNAQNFAFPGKWADEEVYGLLAVNVDCSAIDNWKTRKDSVLPRAVYYMMGKLFGAWTELPAQTTQPISYPRCNGEWVGEVNGPNPDIGVPLPTQGPVTSAPLGTLPPSTTTAPSVIATPIQDNNNNNNPNSASGVVCSLAVVIFSLIALVF